jgi:hypothetical protein
MAEYYGYKSRQGSALDFAGMGAELAGAFESVKTQREARRAANEKLKTDTQSLIDSYQPVANKTVNDLVYSGASTGRDKLLEWNRALKAGELAPRDYREKVNSLKDSWNVLAFSAKTLDERLLAALERQNPGEDGTPGPASSVEMFMTADFAKNKNLNNKTIHIGDDGRVFLAALDGQGKLDPNNIQDIKTMANIDNLVDNRIDLNTAVKDGVSNWGEVQTWRDLGYGATSTENDARQNPAFKAAKFDLIESIVDEDRPRSVASILLDNSSKGYRLYKTEEDKEKAINEAVRKAKTIKGSDLTEAELNQTIADTEGKLIRMTQGANGSYEPEITDKMINDAKKVVEDQIEMQLGFSKEGTPEYKQPVERSSGDDDKDQKKADENNKLLAGYKSSLKAFGFDPESVRANPDDSTKWARIENDFGGLTGKYRYHKLKDGRIQVLSQELDKKKNRKVLFVANDPKQLSQYIYGGQDVAAAQMKWDKARKMYMGGSSKQGGSNDDPLGLGL